MKRIYPLAVAVFISLTGFSQANITSANQYEMITAFMSGSSKVIFTDCEGSNTFSKPQATTKDIIVYDVVNNKSNQTTSFKTKIESERTFKAYGSKNYPLCYVGEAKGKLFFLGNTAIYVKTSEEITEPKHVDEKLGDKITAAVITSDKDIAKNMTVDNLKTMLKEYLEKSSPKYYEDVAKTKTERTAAMSNYPKQFECGGVKMDIKGKKISDYTNNNGEKYQEFLHIEDDTVHLQQVVNSNNVMYMLKTISVPINYFYTNSPYCIVKNDELDGESMYRVSLPISQGFQYLYWQMMCKGNRFGKFEPESVNSSYPLTVTYHDQAEANQFMATMKDMRAAMNDPDYAKKKQESQSTGKESVRLGFFNDSGADMEIWIGSTKKTIHKTEHWSKSIFNVGDKIYRGVPGSSTRGSVIITITKDMDGKEYCLGTGKLK